MPHTLGNSALSDSKTDSLSWLNFLKSQNEQFELKINIHLILLSSFLEVYTFFTSVTLIIRPKPQRLSDGLPKHFHIHYLFKAHPYGICIPHKQKLRVRQVN